MCYKWLQGLMFRIFASFLLMLTLANAQVYSPKVLRDGQPDASSLARLAQTIYAQSGARTPREKAEAVWRFFLTDGRFVKPGFWYHIAGWAYEEPTGEVLDPIKLMNSYGFGLCYQIAPVLADVWKAGGFEDARVWFLTGHTVAEVFYEGSYHYFDSDMMGYNPVEDGRVASVHEIERDGRIILGKMKGPREVATALVSSPWYPADVRAGAMDGLVKLFTTTSDNWLFTFERAPHGHTMDFVLRPGEKMIRYFAPERDDLFYLPYEETTGGWREFPREVRKYQIRTEDGPHSQRDTRRWATGRIEYDAPLNGGDVQVFEVRSPYVIIDAEFQMSGDGVLETSTDGGAKWIAVSGGRPAILTRSEHGVRTAVSGRYDYQVRLTRGAGVRSLKLITRFQVNPRTLPEIASGRNLMRYSSGEAVVRRALVPGTPAQVRNAKLSTADAQGLWMPGQGDGEVVFRVHPGEPLQMVDAGARFLDLSRGLAPDKFTAEVRRISPLPAEPPAASIAWSASPDGPFQAVWEYDPKLKWRDGVQIDRTLLWPEADCRIAVSGRIEIFVRYRFRGMAMDSVRLAAESRGEGATPLMVTHLWAEDGTPRGYTKKIAGGAAEYEIAASGRVENRAIIFECLR